MRPNLRGDWTSGQRTLGRGLLLSVRVRVKVEIRVKVKVRVIRVSSQSTELASADLASYTPKLIV